MGEPVNSTGSDSQPLNVGASEYAPPPYTLEDDSTSSRYEDDSREGGASGMR